MITTQTSTPLKFESETDLTRVFDRLQDCLSISNKNVIILMVGFHGKIGKQTFTLWAANFVPSNLSEVLVARS